MEVIYDGGETRVLVLDSADPEAGGAHHEYSVEFEEGVLDSTFYQHGPVKEEGHNGIQHIHQLKMIEHRLECFQAGPLANEINVETLVHVKAAIASDERRRAKREAVGVEGQSLPVEGVVA